MANPEHFDILKQGVYVWNMWRMQHPEIIPDLNEVVLAETGLSAAKINDLAFEALIQGNEMSNDFRASDFRNINLSRAELRKAKLYGIDLCGADLSGADLSEADISEADLSAANLKGANLSGAACIKTNLGVANLQEANLSRANLTSATLIQTDLTKANLNGAQLPYSNLSSANLSNANLNQTSFWQAYLKKAILREADLREANLYQVNLSEADLSEAICIRTNFREADLREANLYHANLSEADLSETICIRTNFREAHLTNCLVYGICVWNVQMEKAEQKNLIITSQGEPIITTDNLKIAQFIHLLLNNEEIREVIDTITTKVILILGRFTDERKKVLDALRDELRKRNYTPVLFDFEKPASRDLTETVSTLAHIARFVIADITDAKSIPQELMLIVPELPSVPVQPLILNSQEEYGMFEHFTRYPWVLPIYRYTDEANLLASINDKVIAPAERKAKELAQH